MIKYLDLLEDIKPENLEGFFVDWPSPPSEDTLFKLLQNSEVIVLAFDEESEKVIGFITAITDGVLSAYIPLVEVLPSYQNQGIGKELIERMLDKLKAYYMIDTTCDENLKSFYSKFGMKPATAMIIRNYQNQLGKQ